MAAINKAARMFTKRTLDVPVSGRGSYTTSSNKTFMDNLVNQAKGAQQSHYQSVAANSKKASRKAAINAEVNRRNASGGPKVNTRPHRTVNKPISQLSDYERKARKAAVGKGRAQREGKRNISRLNGIDPNKGLLSRIGASASVLGSSALSNLRTAGNLKKAGIGTLQSSVASAGIHGGLAYIQGDDPWEAAKTGAVRGALAGAGYQGLKAATHANAGSIKGNIKHMASTTKQTYKAHTAAGNASMRQNGVSNQLARVLDNNRMARQTEGIFGFNK